MNQARYKDLAVAGGQASEILAQVGALVRTGKPLGGLKVRKMVLAGTSMSAGTLINYLPAHRVFRTPEMQRIYDGFYADVERLAHPRRRRAGRAPADDARGVGGEHHRPRRTATSPAGSIASTRSPAWRTSTRATACG